MKLKHLCVLLAFVLVCMTLGGCAGMIPPTIGESVTAALEEETAAVSTGGDASGETSASGEMSGSASGESDASDEISGEVMVGNLVYHFEHTQELSSSLGGVNDFIATVDLYDEANENGKTGLISLVWGSYSSEQSCTWALENGVFTLTVDEFTSYESRDIDGVPTIVSVRYSFFMASGTVDIPLVGEIEASNEPSGEASGEAV